MNRTLQILLAASMGHLAQAQDAVTQKEEISAESGVSRGVEKDERSSLNQALATFRNEIVTSKEVAGAVTLVGDREKILSFEVTGLADLATQRPMKTDSVVWIASMTKPITGVAVMMMVEEGKIALDDPVSKYIPEFKDLKDADGNPVVVTIAQCMSHTAGLQDLAGKEEGEMKTLDEVVKLTATRPVKFAPGTKWAYCQTGINVGGRIVEIVSQQNFAEFLEKRLFGPLGMKDTTFYPNEEQVARMALSYKDVDGKPVVAPAWVLAGKGYGDTSRYPRANGGLFSTAEDYGKFVSMVMNGGEANGHRFLKPATIAEMLRSHTDGIDGVGFVKGNAYGIGWIRVVNPGGVTAGLSPGSYGHGGAFGTQAWVDPVKGRYSVLIIQTANPGYGDSSVLRGKFQDAAAK